MEVARGVEVLSYWNQEYGTEIASGAHVVHFLKMETFFPLEGIFSSPKCTLFTLSGVSLWQSFHSFPHDLVHPHMFAMSQPKLSA